MPDVIPRQSFFLHISLISLSAQSRDQTETFTKRKPTRKIASLQIRGQT